jgi:metal-responsive CopG/Arc/MetJ family transcriptional regulator
MKVQISIDDELVKRVDNYADKNYLTRSGLISLACSQYLTQNEALMAVKDISLAIRKIADSGKIDEETENKLKEFEIFVNMLTGK